MVQLAGESDTNPRSCSMATSKYPASETDKATAFPIPMNCVMLTKIFFSEHRESASSSFKVVEDLDALILTSRRIRIIGGCLFMEQVIDLRYVQEQLWLYVTLHDPLRSHLNTAAEACYFPELC